MIDITIRKMVAADLPSVVNVHQKAFKGFFLEKMGPRFLLCYYQAVLNYNNSFAFVAVDEKDGLLGFTTGFRNPDQFYVYFRKVRHRLLPAIALAVVRNPSLIRDIIRNSRRVSNTINSDAMNVELSSIASSASGKGIGKALLNKFCSEAFGGGARMIELKTDEMENNKVRRFYEMAGFKIMGTEQRRGRTLSIYQLSNAKV